MGISPDKNEKGKSEYNIIWLSFCSKGLVCLLRVLDLYDNQPFNKSQYAVFFVKLSQIIKHQQTLG